MSGAVETGSPRPRPLSGGFWTLLSWLRREDHSSSNESLSSAGSDRTAVSFAFLTPAHYSSSAPPLILPPPGPPSDTYKKRVRERNLRRQYDRDITLHRKYGLFRGEGVSGYDAFSLPPARRSSGGLDRQERERRATSECYQRRAAYVPGKRRAPLPPTRAARGTSLDSAAVNRRHSRKRRAPQPPINVAKETKDIVAPCKVSNMSVQPKRNNVQERHKVTTEIDRIPEKYTKKDSKEGKTKIEKSFLKQIFENKKRISAVDIAAVKVLPSISELDRQASEIIENTKLKHHEEKMRQQKISQSTQESRISCLVCKGACNCNKLSGHKDNSNEKASITLYTQTDIGPCANITKLDEKQKLKEMLKEMKDSLPKRPKTEIKVAITKRDGSITSEKDIMVDTPTLRIGSSNLIQDRNLNSSSKPSTSSQKVTKLIDPKYEEIPENTNVIEPAFVKDDFTNIASNSSETENKININGIANLHTPLKISSLLNPIYVPKSSTSSQTHITNIVVKQNSTNKDTSNTTSNVDPVYVKTADAVRDIILNSTISENLILRNNSQLPKANLSITNNSSSITKLKNENISCNTQINENKGITNINKISEHAKRRELVNQLEQSIAKGDERAAADAASKLAQLKLSCSVLSFSSQIIAGPSTSAPQSTDKNILTKQSLLANAELKNGLNLKRNGDVHQTPLGETLKTCKEDVAVASSSKNQELNETKLSSGAKDSKILTASSSTKASKQVIKNTTKHNNVVTINVWIEDKVKARGPIQMHIHREAIVGELRRQAEQCFGLPARLQRWIVGQALCSDDNMKLISLAGPTLNAPFYLCLVDPDTNRKPNLEPNEATKKDDKDENKLLNRNVQNPKANNNSDVYSQLVELERQALVPNTEKFECEICMEQCNTGDGVVLRECIHSFCKGCLSDVIRHCEEPTVSCPAMGCPGELHEREIRALVGPEDYERWLARGLAAAESGTRNAFHCRTRDCTGWALCELEVRRFPCPVCKHTNCVPCKAIHENETCEQYRAKLQEAAAVNVADQTDEGTQALIDSLIKRGEALKCPECSAIITKKWGCDWVKCSACKTEICWVTKGRRWGPAGRGDTSGGCRCGVDGQRCHPSCAYCH